MADLVSIIKLPSKNSALCKHSQKRQERVFLHIHGPECAVDQGLTDFCHKGPDNKYVQVCGLHGLCCNYSRLQLAIHKQMSMTLF